MILRMRSSFLDRDQMPGGLAAVRSPRSRYNAPPLMAARKDPHFKGKLTALPSRYRDGRLSLPEPGGIYRKDSLMASDAVWRELRVHQQRTPKEAKEFGKEEGGALDQEIADSRHAALRASLFQAEEVHAGEMTYKFGKDISLADDSFPARLGFYAGGKAGHKMTTDLRVMSNAGSGTIHAAPTAS